MLAHRVGGVNSAGSLGQGYRIWILVNWDWMLNTTISQYAIALGWGRRSGAGH